MNKAEVKKPTPNVKKIVAEVKKPTPNVKKVVVATPDEAIV